MIQVEGLSKRYARHVAVNNISFGVEKGDVVGFLGPNGAGKTTTMRILTCFMPPTEGDGGALHGRNGAGKTPTMRLLTGFTPPPEGKASVGGFDVFEQPFEVKKRI